MPLRTMRGVMPRRRSQVRNPGMSYALSACSLSGRRRRGPRRDRTAGMASTRGLRAHVATHELRLDGPIREYYLVGRQDTADENAWRTEICWPIFSTGAAA